MLQAILFDLDGTLLPMDNDSFTKVYFGYLAKTAAAWGYTDAKLLIKAVWDGVAAMVRNDGSRTNYEVFWECFEGIFGEEIRKDIPRFNTFYENEFHRAREAAFPTELAKTAVEVARAKAERVILATNPIFPRSADVTRLSWIGLGLEDFDLVTDYENSCFSKPNPAYYQKILEQFGLEAGRCMMIGNDVDEDILAAGRAGIPGFLLNDFVINRKGKPVECPQGNYEEMISYIRKLP